MDKTVKKVVMNRCNENNGNSNITCIRLKFVRLPSTIDQVISSNLQL